MDNIENAKNGPFESLPIPFTEDLDPAPFKAITNQSEFKNLFAILEQRLPNSAGVSLFGSKISFISVIPNFIVLHTFFISVVD